MTARARRRTDTDGWAAPTISRRPEWCASGPAARAASAAPRPPGPRPSPPQMATRPRRPDSWAECARLVDEGGGGGGSGRKAGLAQPGVDAGVAFAAAAAKGDDEMVVVGGVTNGPAGGGTGGGGGGVPPPEAGALGGGMETEGREEGGSVGCSCGGHDCEVFFLRGAALHSSHALSIFHTPRRRYL